MALNGLNLKKTTVNNVNKMILSQRITKIINIDDKITNINGIDISSMAIDEVNQILANTPLISIDSYTRTEWNKITRNKSNAKRSIVLSQNLQSNQRLAMDFW